MPSPSQRLGPYFSIQDSRNIALFGLAYLVAYGYGSLFGEGASSPLWFPDSVLLCALLLTPKKKWWLYLMSAALIRWVPGLRPPVPGWFIWATFINDAAKAALAAYLLQRVAGSPVRLNTIRKFAAYLGIAVFLVPMLSALCGAAARRALGYDFWPAWSQWFSGNALAHLVITPTLLQWSWREYRPQRARVAEAALWLAGFSICLRYTVLLTRSNDSPIALYTPIPFLVWAAARFGTIGASSALSLMALFLMLGIASTSPLFSGHPAAQNLHFVQLFLAIICLPILFLAVLIEERQAVATRLRESQEELNKNYERVSDLAGKLIRAQEDERKRIARELHDDVSQRLALLIWGLDGLAGELPNNTVPGSHLAKLKRDAEGVAQSVRELSHQLHSATLRHLGIARGLEGLCKAVALQHHVEVDLETEQIHDLSDEVSLCLFRVAQEALTNAVKHGKAKRVAVRLGRDPDLLRLEIRDTGVGFNPAAASQGLGLVSMRERLRMVGGTLLLTSSHGQGTVIEATVDCGQVNARRQAAS